MSFSTGEEDNRNVEPLDGVRRSSSRAILWNIVLLPMLGLLSLVSSTLVARSLSLDQYRVFGLATAAVASLLLYSDLGISSAVARFTPKLRELGPTATDRFLRGVAKIRLFAIVVIVALLLLCRYLWPSFWDAVLPFYGASLWLIVLIVMAQSLARVLQYFLTGLFQRKTIGVIQLVATGAQSALVILAAVGGAGVVGILGALALAAMLELLLSHSAAREEAKSHQVEGGGDGFPPGFTRDALRFSGASFAERIASYLNSPRFVIFQIATLGASIEVAFFTVATDFAMRFISLLSMPFSGVTFPLFSTVDTREDPSKLASVLRLYLMLLILLFVPTAAILASIADPLVPLLYGERYLEAVPMLRWLIPFVFLEYTVYSALLASLMVRGKYKLVLLAKTPLLVGVAAVTMAIPRWGATGAVIAFGSARLVSAAMLLGVGIRELQFRVPGRYASKVLLASAGGALTIALARPALPGGWLALVGLAFLGSASFYLFYRATGGMDDADRLRIVSGLPGPVRRLRYLL